MVTRWTVHALVCGAVLASQLAHADFRQGLKDYTSGNYEAAHAQFLALAELGDGASQFNLGAMALQGQAGPKDVGSGVGWLVAAAGNGYLNMPPEKLAALRAKLTADQQTSAQVVIDHYGHTALLNTVLPPANFGVYCSDTVEPSAVELAPLEYPSFQANDRHDGIVILELTIGADGLARDPEVLMAAPTEDFPAAAVKSWIQGRFEPAARAGVPIESRVQVKASFTMSGGGALWSVGALRKVRDESASGEPGAQYLIGLAGSLDSSLQIPTEKAYQLLLSAAQGGQPQAQYWVGRRFAEMARCGQEGKDLASFQQAATAGYGPAQLALATHFLSAAASADSIAQAKALLEKAAQSDSFYARKHVAALMAASPIEGIHDPVTALAVARKLANGEIQVDPQMFEAVAVAYAINSNFSAAVSNQETAIKKAKALSWNTSLMAERLKAYQGSQPWTGDLFTVPPATTKPAPLKDAVKACYSGTPGCNDRAQPDTLKAPIGSRLPR